MVKQASLQWNRLRRYLIADPGRFAGGPDQGKTQGVPRAPPAAHLSDGEIDQSR
jgi:hypothetical protein